MNKNHRTVGTGMRAPLDCCRRLALAALVLITAGCTAPVETRDPQPASLSEPVEHASADIRIRLIDVRQAGDPNTLVKDPGWLEYVLSVENRGQRALTVRNVKLLNRDGRYLDSASSYDQIVVPPDTASEIAGTVANRAAGAAAGQVIPYGGTIVGILSSALSASAAESTAAARQELDRRKLKDIELAPAGRMTGSTFLPRVNNAKALVVDYGHGADAERIEIPLPRQGT